MSHRADSEALEALKAENKRIETELEELRRQSEILDLELSNQTLAGSQASAAPTQSQNDFADLKREMHDLADKVMADAKAKPAPRTRKPKASRKSTATKSGAAKSPRKKTAAGKERRPRLSQRLREMADN